jgi:putative PIN family toxin of toxin-antitoxin system
VAEPPGLVIDTNVFVSGLISPSGFPARILQAIRQKRAIHLVSDPIVEEYLRVLDYPRIRKFERVTDEFILSIASYLTYQTSRVELVSKIRLSPDPDDDKFLQTAIDGAATLLVTGDKTDLLALEEVEDIPIVTASEAVARLRL